MSSSEDLTACFAAGTVMAEKCVQGYADIEKKYNYATSSLRPSVYLNFKRELIYFRIFIAYFEFQTQLNKENFEYFLLGFKECLTDTWDSRLVDGVQHKLKKYGEKFIVKENTYLKLSVTDGIVDELLVNSGFSVEDYISFDRTELKRIFRIDLQVHKLQIDRFLGLLLMNDKERAQALKELGNLPPLTINY